MKIGNIAARRIVIIMIFLLCSVDLTLGGELTPKQNVFQNELINFLKEEGFFSNQKDGSNVIYFKKEGVLHWITISDEEPFFITFSRRGFSLVGPDAYKKELMLKICNEINATHKCVKMYCEENTAVLQIEQYVSSMKEYMKVFYSNLKSLESANDVFEKLYDDKKAVPMSASEPVESMVRKNFDSVFFPVLGVYLGKTTTIELRNKGQNPIDEQGITYNIDGVIFKDTDGDTIIDYMYITRSTIMPQQWIKTFKFEWELPYNSWLLRLKRADLKPNVLEKPKIIRFEGRKVLKAKIKAISNNNLLEFTFDFDKGNPKGNKSVSIFRDNSLYSISVKTK